MAASSNSTRASFVYPDAEPPDPRRARNSRGWGRYRHETERVGIAPIAGPVASRAPVDLPTLSLYLAAFGVALVLTRRRPALGVAMLVAAIPYDFSRDVGPTTLTLAKATLAGLVAGLLLRRPLWAVWSREAAVVGAGALAVLLATLLSIHAADFKGPAIRESFKALQYLIVFGATLLAVRADPGDRAVPYAVVLTTAGVASLALVQIVTGAPSGVWFSGEAIPRIAGPLEGPNQLSGYLGIALPCVLALGLSAGASGRERGAAFVALALGGAALLLTLSRAGVATTLAALAAVFALAPASRELTRARRDAAVALGAGLAAGIGLLGTIVLAITHSLGLFHAVLGRFGTAAEVEHAGGVGNRSILWHAALTLWRAHPLFGIGAGNFELEVGRAGPAGVRTHANNLYLQALVEGGLPLFAATAGSLVATLTVLLRALRRARDPLVLGTACGLAGLAVHQLFDLLVFYPKIGDFVWALTGAAVARIVPVPPPDGDVRPPRALSGTKFTAAR